MKPKITLLVLFFLIGINNVFSQFTPQKPDLRLCGTPPTYYEGYFNCTSNNYTLDRVFLSLTNVNGVPLSNTTCAPGQSQQMYVMLNYTSNSSSTISQTRLFADLSIDGVIIPINAYLGNVDPGAGQRQIYGPFNWTCGQQLRLCRILTVWQTSGNPSDPELSSYNCNTYGKSQCEFASCMLVAAPLGVHYTYSVCNNNGNQAQVTFQDHTTGGVAPYSYSWNFGDGSPVSTQQNPVHNFAYPGGPYTVTLTITDSNTPTRLVGTYTQVITPPGPITIDGVVNSASCANQSNGSIDVSVTGGTAPYTYSWNNGATTQDLAGLATGTYTITVTDAFGCVKSKSFTINSGDTSNPVVNAPNDVTIEGCGTASIIGLPYSATPATITMAQFTAEGGTYTDASSIASITYQDVASGSCPTRVTRTFRLTDACGNVGSDQQIITINDTTPPVIATLPAPTTINCPNTPQFEVATATDNCSVPTLTFNDVTTLGQCAGSYSVTRTWTATDACGNSSTKSETINVQDVTGPVIAALPAPTTINCPDTPQFAQATATDGCNSTFTLTFNDVTTTGQCAGSYSVTRTWTATDTCGNSSTSSQTINVQDITTPVIADLPAPSTINCPNTPQFAQATATDGCSSAFTLTFNDVTTPGACAGSYSVTRTWTATDACGNSSTKSQTINVQDTTAPIIADLPAPSTIDCPNTPQFTQATATDGCGSAFTLTYNDVTTPGLCAGSYSVTRTWTARDNCGNSSTKSQTINVQDVTAPVIGNLPAPTTINCPNTPQFAQATATDDCGSAFTLTFNDITTPGQCAGSYSVTRTWTATDACGNSSTKSQTINVQDVTAPVIANLPAPTTINCPNTPQFAQATATDSCNSTFTLTFNDVTTPGQCAGSYSVTRTWTATDTCGNSSTKSQTINVQDVSAPVIAALPAPSTISCPDTPQFAQATATDGCGSTFTLTYNDVTTPGQCAGSYSVTRTWTARDTCGNSSTRSQTINVQDTTAPVIADLPAPSTINCPNTPQFAQATATDGCSSAFTLIFNDVTTPGACAGSYSVTRTWTARDNCGNSSTKSQTINVQDLTAPVIAALPATSTINCPSTPQFAQATATDGCGSTFTLTYNDVTTPGLCAGSYSVTRTWTARDTCGNSSTASQTINVQDITAPVIAALPAPSTINCPAVPQFAQATATDSCGSAITLTFNDVTTPGQCPGSYSVTRTWTAVDACGNSSTRSQTINVHDVAAPVRPQAPANVTVSCSGDIPPMISLTANDACDGPITVLGVDAVTNGSCSSSFTVTRTWTFVDACGNSSSVSQTINVSDTSNPVLPTPPANITVSCAEEIPPMTSLTATDTCAGQITVSGVDNTPTRDCPNSYVITRTWRFTDPCGNTSSVSQTITVSDTINPVISALPAPTTINCTQQPQFAQPTASDNCTSPVTLTFADLTTPGQCAGSYSITRTWTALDACGNSSTRSQTINVEDTTAPVIASLPGSTKIDCSEILQFAQATATDDCSSPISLTFNDVTTPGDCPGNYSVTRTWTAMDACGNSSTASQTIDVDDITSPVIETLPGPSTIDCTETLQFAQAVATDNCSLPILTYTDVTTPGECPGSYSVTRTWTAVDDCRNQSSASQTINVQDITPPVIASLPEASTINCPAQPEFTQAIATDNCSLPIGYIFEDVTTPGECAGSYSVTRTWTVSDDCGNSSTASQTINVQDVDAPIAPQAPSDITVSCGTEMPVMTALTANDNCIGDITVEGVDVITPGDCVNSYTVVRTWTFTDACDNTSSVSQTITVSDETPPTLPELPADITVSCISEVPAPLFLTAVDNCTGNISAESVDVVEQGACPNSFIVTRTWTFTDACSNTSAMTQIITVSDETGPELVGNLSDETVTCGNIPTPLNLQFSDNCGGEVAVTFEEHVDPESVIEGAYNIIRTWTAADICSNVTVISQTVHVTVGDTFSSDNPDFCKNDTAFANFNLMSLLPEGTEPGGQWISVSIPIGVINHTTNTINATQLPVGYYTLQYILTTDQSPCPRKLEFYVHVDDKCGVLAECAINVFNGFSPDGDGENDILVIDGLQCYAENNVQIYNRWGILVFDKSGYNNTTVYFDGKSEGRSTLNKNELLPGGTYFYIVKYKDNEAGNWHDKSGYLYLSR